MSISMNIIIFASGIIFSSMHDILIISSVVFFRLILHHAAFDIDLFVLGRIVTYFDLVNVCCFHEILLI